MRLGRSATAGAGAASLFGQYPRELLLVLLLLMLPLLLRMLLLLRQLILRRPTGVATALTAGG